MAKIAYRCRSEDTKAVGNGGMKMREGDQSIEKPGIQERNPSIDKIALKIFVPPSSFRLKDNIFITEKGVRDGQNVGWDDQEEIMDACIEEIVKGCIDKSSENCIPSPHP
jgi:hypothetical protein